MKLYASKKDTLDVSWKAVDKNGVAKIRVSTTNRFKEGRNDVYTLATTVPLASEHARINVSKYQSSLFKIVIETPHHFLNRWVITETRNRKGN